MHSGDFDDPIAVNSLEIRLEQRIENRNLHGK
jgi:hypothetical protein